MAIIRCKEAKAILSKFSRFHILNPACLASELRAKALGYQSYADQLEAEAKAQYAKTIGLAAVIVTQHMAGKSLAVADAMLLLPPTTSTASSNAMRTLLDLAYLRIHPFEDTLLKQLEISGIPLADSRLASSDVKRLAGYTHTALNSNEENALLDIARRSLTDTEIIDILGSIV